MNVGVVFPHQLFENSSLIAQCDTIYLVEEFLFFRQYKFHKQKIAFHRASMKFYEDYLQSMNLRVVYIEAFNDLADVRNLMVHFKSNDISSFEYIDTTDCWLELRIAENAERIGLKVERNTSPLFLNSTEEIKSYFEGKKRMFQTDFYKYQRKVRNILVDPDKKPIGNKWTFDDENRLKYPKGKQVPEVDSIDINRFYREAIGYTEEYFSSNYGALDSAWIYPTTFSESKVWLDDFLTNRFREFGAYEDAILADENVLHHSVLTPMMNVGLLTPQEVVDKAVRYAAVNDVPLNSTEGFIRQIIGWREFVRAVYQLHGTDERTKNYWGFKRKIPQSFWTGNTGIEPIDITIRKVLKTGYCHHIERLMVLGNFMLLCEFDPDEVYRWFMEMFIDSYDWVMVPNVYGMSQFADGGLMSTKPYISGSNYLMKMSNYQKGDWQVIWDSLFWRFMHVHRAFFIQNPRLGMLVRSFDGMAPVKQQGLIKSAEEFIHSLG